MAPPSLPLHGRFSELAWRHTNDFVETASEVALICEARCNGYFRKGKVRATQKLSSLGNTALQHEVMRRGPLGLLEGAGKVSAALWRAKNPTRDPRSQPIVRMRQRGPRAS